MRCDEEAIRLGLEAPLPKFEDDFKPKSQVSAEGTGNAAAAEEKQQQIAASLPSLDDLDFSEPQNVQTQSAFLPALQPPAQPQAAVNPGQAGLTEEQKASIWYLRPEDKANYMKIFKMFDKNGSGSLT